MDFSIPSRFQSTRPVLLEICQQNTAGQQAVARVTLAARKAGSVYFHVKDIRRVYWLQRTLRTIHISHFTDVQSVPVLSLLFNPGNVTCKFEPSMASSNSTTSPTSTLTLEACNGALSKTLTDMISSITPITPYLSVSGCLPVCTKTLIDENYTAAVCCMDGFKYEFPPDRIEFVHIRIADARETDLSPYMDRVCDLIEKHGRNGRTLVFCAQGISRSVSFILAYLMKYEKMTLLDAFDTVRQRRKLACPNVGFFKQLIELERKTHNGKQTVNIIEPYKGFEVADVVWKCSGDMLKEFRRDLTSVATNQTHNHRNNSV